MVCAWPAPARADVAAYLGRNVASIRLVIDGRESDDPSLVRILDIRVGQPLSMRDVRETELHLFAMGRFEDVRVDASTVAGGVAVRFDLTSLRPVSAIEFAGDVSKPGVDPGQLRRVVTDRAGPSPARTRLDELSRLVEAALRARGYLRARVTGRIEPNGPTHTRMVFVLDAGVRAAVGTITVSAPAAARGEFLAQLQLAAGAPFERDVVAARIDKYVAGRRAQGYYAAKVTWDDRPSEDDRTVDLSFTVDPGRHVRIVFTGDPVPGDKKDLVPVEREGSVDEDLLEDATARIEDALRAQGYKDARAPHDRMDVEGELVITFHVTRGQQYRIAKVSVEGNTSIPLADLQPVLGLREGQPFSQAALDSESAAIEDVYRRSGFAAAKADENVVPEAASGGEVPLDITIVVREGVRTLVKSVSVTGNTSIPSSTLLGGLRLAPGRPFVVASLAADRDDIFLRYLNAGYENATVDARPELNSERTEATITYAVREGSQMLVDHVLISGVEHTDQSIIEKQLKIHSGDPLSLDAVRDSQRRLQALGLYRNVTITELGRGGGNRRDLLVSVEEGPSTSIAYGGGFEFARRVEAVDNSSVAQERFDSAPRASFQISRRNLFGTNRSATFFSSLTLHPQGTPQSGTTEYNVVGTFREPQVFDTAVDGLITLTAEQQFRTGFNFRQQSVTAEATRRLGKGLSVIGTYLLQKTEVFDNHITDPSEQSAIDRVFPQVRLSSFSVSVLRDTRNDQIDPTTGEYFSGYGQLAARALGGQVGFVKSFFRASMFRLLPHTRVVLAGNAFLGLATGFPFVDAATGEVAHDLPQSERFYAGGDTTMRGFALDQLGVRHIPPQPNDTIDTNGFPIGGNSEGLVNLELRAPAWHGVEGHTFLDTGNVFKRVTLFDVSQFRSAVGFGVLYKSPIGPLRFDLGFKVHPLPGESLTAFFITFGQAF
ncbi:MAG TPA: POTRA domain-containing protein [Vicinamibacterales bacterium]|nr:POTRA domain-containing protein [Vicinamibacterales bacterium]